MTFEEYQAIKAINASAIKAGMVSMKHMHHALTGGGKDDTPAMRWGRLVHLSVLEPARFDKVISVYDGRRAGKEWYAFAQSHDLEYVVKPDELDQLKAISKAVHSNKTACYLIGGSEHEVTLEWETIPAGKCKARLDGLFVSPGGPMMFDLKSTSAVTKERFGGQFTGLHYREQFGWYASGVKAVHGHEPMCYCIAVESTEPYDTIVYRISYDIVRAGAEQANAIAAKYRACEACNTFPGVDDGVDVVDLVLPVYGRTDVEKDMSNGNMEASEL